jgi:hypothetical protein
LGNTAPAAAAAMATSSRRSAAALSAAARERATEYVSERKPMVTADGEAADLGDDLEIDRTRAAVDCAIQRLRQSNDELLGRSMRTKGQCCRRCCCCCCCLLLLLALAGAIIKALLDHEGPLALPEKSPVRLWPRLIASSQLFNLVLQPSATSRKGREYFEQQLPLLEASARSFDCLDYWCKNLTVPSMEANWLPGLQKYEWYSLLTYRYDMMLEKMRADPRADDFRMEKNKCDMYDWYALNGFRAMRVIYRWSARGEWGTSPASGAQQVVTDLLENRTGHDFPMYLKMCHLTQGWQRATRRLKSREELEANRAEVEDWIGKLWAVHPDDWERPWAAAHNMLTDTLSPGALVQELYPGNFVGNYDPAAEEVGAVVELKTYVIWGHAYMGSIHDILLLRDGTMEDYHDQWLSMLHGHVSSKVLQWVVTEGHLERAFFMAETAALVAGMDMVRMDFFLRKGDPAGIVFNEDSISSARSPIYHHHFDHMSYAWARGHVERWYRPFDAGGKRTYELSLHNEVVPNKQRIRLKLASNAALAEEVGLHMSSRSSQPPPPPPTPAPALTVPTTPYGSCWMQHPSGCPCAAGSGCRTANSTAYFPVGWNRDTYGENNLNSRTFEGCMARAIGENAWCGTTNVETYYVPFPSPSPPP